MANHRTRKYVIKSLVWQKTGGVCARCGASSPEARQTIDHYIPRSKGGTDDLRNFIPLCKKCNKYKAYHLVDLEEYYPYLPKQAVDSAREYENLFFERTNK